jgi:hypothetical protein
MSPDILMKGVVAAYLASPQGIEMIRNFIASQEGRKAIREYLVTPREMETARDILPMVPDAAGLPDAIKEFVREKHRKEIMIRISPECLSYRARAILERCAQRSPKPPPIAPFSAPYDHNSSKNSSLFFEIVHFRPRLP